MSEYIGSRISLISKSDIRYEGTLHEINSENSTVALEQVVCFGTEGRRNNPDEEIAGSDSVYEYIRFRGSDVKDLRVHDRLPENKPPPPPQIPNDPAILGSSSRSSGRASQPQVPQQPSPAQPPNQPANFQQPPPPFQTPPYNQHQNQRFDGAPFNQQQGFQGAPGGFQGYPAMPYGAPPGAPPGWYHPPGHGYPQQPGPPPMPFVGPGQQNQLQRGPPGPGPPGQPTPPNQGFETPPTDVPVAPARVQPVAAADTTEPASQTTIPAPSRPANEPPPPPIDSKPDLAAALAPSDATSSAEASKSVPIGPRTGKVIPAVPLANAGAKSSAKPARPAPGLQNTQASAAKPGQIAADAALQYQSATQAATAAVQAAMAKLPPAPGQKPKQGGATASENLAEKVNDMRIDDKIRHSRQPGTGGFAAGHRGGRGAGNRRGGGVHPKGIEVPTTDFDFETANAQFNKEDLVKEAIASGDPAGQANEGTVSEVVNGGSPAPEGDVVIPPVSSATAAYSKGSFFDNLSSEAKEREDASASNQRKPTGSEFRTEERKRNLETFGMGSVDGGYRGGFRGRGRGRGYRGRSGRGGGRGGYRARGDTANVAAADATT